MGNTIMKKVKMGRPKKPAKDLKKKRPLRVSDDDFNFLVRVGYSPQAAFEYALKMIKRIYE
jgi:hypothetical protein